MNHHNKPVRGRRWGLPIAVLCVGLVTMDSQYGLAERRKGHEVTGSRITVNSPSHWTNWTLPTHAVEVTEKGVQPHFSRDRYNLLEDLGTFTRTLSELKRKKGQHTILNIDSTETLDVRREVISDNKGNPLYTYFVRPGISRVGSNPEQAANILDGDPATFWEPAPEDPIEDWWVEVDLGRAVPVEEIVLHFVEEALGDPFRQFRVLVAPDQYPILERAEEVEFLPIGRTLAPWLFSEPILYISSVFSQLIHCSD